MPRPADIFTPGAMTVIASQFHIDLKKAVEDQLRELIQPDIDRLISEAARRIATGLKVSMEAIKSDYDRQIAVAVTINGRPVDLSQPEPKEPA